MALCRAISFFSINSVVLFIMPLNLITQIPFKIMLSSISTDQNIGNFKSWQNSRDFINFFSVKEHSCYYSSAKKIPVSNKEVLLIRHSRAMVPPQRFISNQWAANTADHLLIKTFSLGNVLSQPEGNHLISYQGKNTHKHSINIKSLQDVLCSISLFNEVHVCTENGTTL